MSLYDKGSLIYVKIENELCKALWRTIPQEVFGLNRFIENGLFKRWLRFAESNAKLSTFQKIVQYAAWRSINIFWLHHPLHHQTLARGRIWRFGSILVPRDAFLS